MQISTCTSSKPSGVPSLKSIFLNNLATKEISVLMHIIFKIIAEIPRNINMNPSDVSFGNFLMRSSPLRAQGASSVWTVRNAMDGWNRDTIHQSTIPKDANLSKNKIFKSLKLSSTKS